MIIKVETTVAAPIERVWRAYANPEDFKQWNAASDDWHTTRATPMRARIDKQKVLHEPRSLYRGKAEDRPRSDPCRTTDWQWPSNGCACPRR
jgi:uncharacterized protein YndB with AHSA1/START domain